MKRIYQTPLCLLASAALVMAVGMLAPSAAHAVIATLVQVVNTPANPAITLDVSRAASQIIEVQCNTPFGLSQPCTFVNPDAANGGQFTVPAGQKLVITEADLTTNDSAGGTNSIQLIQRLGQNNAVREGWTFPSGGAVMRQLQFGSGIVIGPGYQIEINFQSTALITNGATITLRGYLTVN
ncbi:MAG: hypothetical protein ABJF23_28605 [Bryobacteraceae bacterium]